MKTTYTTFARDPKHGDVELCFEMAPEVRTRRGVQYSMTVSVFDQEGVLRDRIGLKTPGPLRMQGCRQVANAYTIEVTEQETLVPRLFLGSTQIEYAVH